MKYGLGKTHTVVDSLHGEIITVSRVQAALKTGAERRSLTSEKGLTGVILKSVDEVIAERTMLPVSDEARA